MSTNKPIRRVAIVGTGVIGASWAAQYLANGLDVIATDPGPDAEASLRNYVDEAWKALEIVGLASGASRDRLTFTVNMPEAVSKADFVQENAPERPDFKIKLFAQMDEVAPPNAILASIPSGITMDVVQSDYPPRTLRDRTPFNPPHHSFGRRSRRGEDIRSVIDTPWRSTRLLAKPIRLAKALPSHVANRLRPRFTRNSPLVQQGVLSVADADAHGLLWTRLRWGVMGPSLQRHLAEGLGASVTTWSICGPLEGLMKAMGAGEFRAAQTVVSARAGRSRERSIERCGKQNRSWWDLPLRARSGSDFPSGTSDKETLNMTLNALCRAPGALRKRPRDASISGCGWRPGSSANPTGPICKRS